MRMELIVSIDKILTWKPIPFIPGGPTPWGIQKRIKTYRNSLHKIMKQNNIGLDKLYMIDFSIPGDVDHGDNPMYEVFSKENWITNEGEWGHEPGSREDFFWTSDGYNSFWFLYTDQEQVGVLATLGNRVKGAGTEETDLLVVIPSFTKRACLVSVYNVMQRIDGVPKFVPRIEKISTVPFPKEPEESEIVSLDTSYGCYETPDGYYYYELLLER